LRARKHGRPGRVSGLFRYSSHFVRKRL